MKTDFKAKLLQHIVNKKEDEGFTLIELLVVIIIIGILSAIALPSFLNQANRARESEAQTYVGTLNRGQQAFYLEENRFTTEISELGLGLNTDTDNYVYAIDSLTTAKPASVVNRAFPAVTDAGGNTNKAGEAPFRAYVGGVNTGEIQGGGEATTFAILCKGEKPEVVGGADGTGAVAFSNVGPGTCPTGYESIN
ncbi:MAG: type IV pilin-like G/H family protein [Elainellaceae cyanobacterium]